MPFEHEPGQFTLFKNDKGDNDKRPDYKGDGKDLQGNPIEVAVWIKQGTKGKFMSCKFKPKEARAESAKAALPAKGASFDEMDDDIPF